MAANIALVYGTVVAGALGAAYLVNRQRRQRARTGAPARPSGPALAYDLSTDDLRNGELVTEFAPGQAVRVKATANPEAGIFWRGALDDVGPQGAPVEIHSSQSLEGGVTVQTFLITALREGSARVLLTAVGPQGQAVDNVAFRVEV